MGPQSRHRSVYSRMETNAEYYARLVAAGVISHASRTAYSSKDLDELGESLDPPIQRRVVEDVA